MGGDGSGMTPDAAGGNATLLTTLGSNVSWHNTLAADVDNDGTIAPLDALLIINKLNAQGAHVLQPAGDSPPGAGGAYWDVTDDHPISAADAQQVIDALNPAPGAGQNIPEPASLSLLLGGLLAALGRRGRRAA